MLNTSNVGVRFQLGATDGTDSRSPWFEITKVYRKSSGLAVVAFRTETGCPLFSGISDTVAMLAGGTRLGILLMEFRHSASCYDFEYELKFS